MLYVALLSVTLYVSRDDVDKARILLELLFVRMGNFRLSNFDVH